MEKTSYIKLLGLASLLELVLLDPIGSQYIRGFVTGYVAIYV